MSSPIHFIDSQDADDNLQDTPIRTIGKRHVVQRKTTPNLAAESLPATSADSRRISSRRSAEKSNLKTTPMAHLRHNDSQIHFAAIASSSPLAPEDNESQLLTERQKEVKERQARDAAAVFPDVRSSLKSRPRNGDKRSPPKLVLGGSHRSHANLDADDDISPVLPSDNAFMKDVFGSSPTPRSNQRVILDLGSDFEPPSSPPSLPHIVLPVVVADQRSDPSPITSRMKQGQIHSSSPVAHSRPQAQEVHLPDTVPAVVSRDEEMDISKQPETAEDTANSEVEAKESIADDYNSPDVLPFSDVDVLVDVPSEPAEEIPATKGDVTHNSSNAEELMSNPKHNVVDAEDCVSNPQDLPTTETQVNPGGAIEQIATPLGSPNARVPGHELFSEVDETSRIMDSFYDDSTSFYSNEDDQIAAQLVRDLERASQQVSPQKNENTGANSLPRKRGRKRKSESGGSRTNSKKAKSVPSTQGIEVVVEIRKAGDNNDCAIVDSRPATSIASPLPEEVKQERSPSPSEDIRAVAKPHEPKANPARRTRSSTAGTPLIQNPPPLSRKRKIATDIVKTEKDGDADDITAQPSRKRRSARLRQACPDRSAIEAISSGEEYKNSAEVSYDRLSLDFNPSDENNQGSSGPQNEGMDTERDSNPRARQPEHGHPGIPTPQGLDEALPRTLRKRARPDQRQEAKSRQVPGSAAGSLDEEEYEPKRRDMDGGRHVEDPETALQQEGNPENLHAPRSSARGLLGSLRQWLGDIKQAILAPEEERAIVDLMFESVREVHEAGRHNTGT